MFPEKSPTLSSDLPTGYEVLVVEDELRIRSMLSAALRGMGFHATLAGTAEAGMKELAGRPFDILMLDLNLPGMDGLQFLKTIRQKYPDLQVIILTGFGDLEAARTAIHLDVVEFLTKPCTLGSLEIALDRARKRRKKLLMSEMPVVVEAEPPSKVSQLDPVPPQPESGAEAFENIERRAILQALEKHNGNRAAAAAELGISLRKLYYRLKQYERS
ncbi:MAG TPA: response regulator [Phycisphaerae bacterium]|jgi:DNA-binding NtrC family response regulator|nr:response regulator [Phycisphaerae bacterium]